MQGFNISDIQVLTNTGLAFMVYGVISTTYISYALITLPKKELERKRDRAQREQHFENLLKKEQEMRAKHLQSGKVAKKRLDQAIQSQKTKPHHTDKTVIEFTGGNYSEVPENFTREERYREVIRLNELGMPLNEISKVLNMGLSEINLLLTLDNRK